MAPLGLGLSIARLFSHKAATNRCRITLFIKKLVFTLQGAGNGGPSCLRPLQMPLGKLLRTLLAINAHSVPKRTSSFLDRLLPARNVAHDVALEPLREPSDEVIATLVLHTRHLVGAEQLVRKPICRQLRRRHNEDLPLAIVTEAPASNGDHLAPHLAELLRGREDHSFTHSS